MAIGIKQFDGSGNLVFDVGTRLFRRIATVTYSGSNGSAGFSSANAQDTDLVAVPRGWYAPEFTVNSGNTTVSWDFSAINVNERRGGIVEIWAR